MAQRDAEFWYRDFAINSMQFGTNLETAQQKCPEVPFIFVSAGINEQEATNYLLQGAVDYISKNQLWRLAPIVQRVVSGTTQQRSPSTFPENAHPGRVSRYRCWTCLCAADCQKTRRTHLDGSSS
jgi:DNA-binding NtrC family response regulator